MDAVMKILLNALTPAGLGSMLRWAMGLVAGSLVARGWLTSDQVGEIVAAVVTALVPLLWALVQKYRQQQLLSVALSLPPGATVEQAKLTLMQAREKGLTV